MKAMLLLFQCILYIISSVVVAAAAQAEAEAAASDQQHPSSPSSLSEIETPEAVSTTTSTLEILKEQIHPLWLRERCLEEFYVDLDTKQPKYNLHEEQQDILTITSIVLEEEMEMAERRDDGDDDKDDDGSGEGGNNIKKKGYYFIVVFSDNLTCFYNKDTIEAELRNDVTFLQTNEKWNFPPLNLWDKSLLAPPIFEHDDIITIVTTTTTTKEVEEEEYSSSSSEDDGSQRRMKFLSTLISTGIALVENVPRMEGECSRFGQRFSTIRDTEWGTNFNVRSIPDTTSTDGTSSITQRKDLAYTNHAIGMHVDSTYRIDGPPAFQLLHAIEHCSPGPDCYVHNYFVDGLRVAADLCKLNRRYFDILSTIPLRWENNGGDDSSFLHRYAPMIELQDTSSALRNSDSCPTVSAISFSAKSGGYAPNLPKEQLEIFYEAKRTFSAMLHSDVYIIRLQLYPGALVIFDNRRVLHSRSSIADTDGERWLQGCYINRDGINYQYEKLRRKLSSTLTETPFRNLREATKADYDRMGREYDQDVSKKTVDNLMNILKSQKDAYLGAPVSLLEHGLQTATRAVRAGEDDETIVMSLFHDMFETLAVKNHGELVSSMLAPWISPRSQWVLAHHEIFQGYYYFGYYGLDPNRRDMFLDHPFYNYTVEWCEKYDQASFDPDYPSLDLSYFRPIAERVLSRTQYWWNLDHPKAGAVSAKEVDVVDDASQVGNENTTVGSSSPAECRETWTCYSISDEERVSN